jgi:hypothetical protein
VPLVVELSKMIDLNTAWMKIEYSASNPQSVTRTGAGTLASPFVYAPAAGALRLKENNGDAARFE